MIGIITHLFSISKVMYLSALIFLPRPCNLSLFDCSHTLSPTLNDFYVLCLSCLALYFSYKFCSVSYTYRWICLIFSINFLALKESPVIYSLTPPCCPYEISKGEGGKYQKNVSNGDFPVEVWTTLL